MIVHWLPSQCLISVTVLLFPMKVSPTAHRSLGAATAIPRRPDAIWVGSGLLTCCQLPVHDGVGGGVEVRVAVGQLGQAVGVLVGVLFGVGVLLGTTGAFVPAEADIARV